MADPSLFDPLRIPAQTLAVLDWRPFHFALQPYHYLVRMAHIISIGAFFGGIGLLYFRLMGWRGTVPLRAFAEHVLPWLWVTFGIAAITGLALFLYTPCMSVRMLIGFQSSSQFSLGWRMPRCSIERHTSPP